MARRWDHHASVPAPPETETRRFDHSTTRAFAAALSALAISSLVVATSSRALQPHDTIAGSRPEDGLISVTDGDGRSLIELTDMAPGRSREECVRIVYEGSTLPVVLTLAASNSGDVAPHVLTSVERGTGAGYDSCADFETQGTVFTGRLSELAQRSPLTVDRLMSQGEGISLRFVFELATDEAAEGRTGATTIVWEVTPD